MNILDIYPIYLPDDLPELVCIVDFFQQHPPDVVADDPAWEKWQTLLDNTQQALIIELVEHGLRYVCDNFFQSPVDQVPETMTTLISEVLEHSLTRGPKIIHEMAQSHPPGEKEPQEQRETTPFNLLFDLPPDLSEYTEDIRKVLGFLDRHYVGNNYTQLEV